MESATTLRLLLGASSNRLVQHGLCVRARPTGSFLSKKAGFSLVLSRHTRHVAFLSSSHGRQDDCPTWEGVQLLERLLQVAVVDENYVEAARLRDVVIDLKERLTVTEQIILVNTTRCVKENDLRKRIQAIEVLRDIGDKSVFPILSVGLRDENHLVVSETEKAMWKIFMRSGRDDVDKRIQEGVSKMVSKTGLAEAHDIFTDVINMDPSFAEGYNKRATVNYLLQEYQKSIEDCHRTLKLNPYHFAALSGLGLCHVALQDPESALCWLEKAYAMHPGLVQISKYIKVLKKKIKEKQAKGE